MAQTPKAKRKLTDAARHKRFVAMAEEVGASKSPRAFDKAFKRITKKTRAGKTRTAD